MSDGSLSQDEIDALLLGGSAESSNTGALQSGASLSASEENALVSLLESTGESQSGTLSGMMGKSISVGSPKLAVVKKAALQGALEDEIVEIKVDFKDGVSGEHYYYLSTTDALKLAGPMIGQDNVELNATAISALGEAISQITGAAVTIIGDKIGKTIMPDAPDGQSIPKTMIRAPQGDLVKVSYNVIIDGSDSLNLIEVFDISLAKQIASLAGGEAESDMMADLSAMTGAPTGGMDDTNQTGGQMGMNQAGGQMGMNQMGGQMGGQMGMNQMGGQQGGQMGGQQYPNVQGIQLPDFGAAVTPSEQRNIGLLMDVSMELTVELGRTKWQIKEILGMGEGTIIELDKLAGEPVDILVNHNLIAKGEVVVIDENFGVRVTEIVSSMDRMQKG
ncbi:MAG: flagellar motor switch phosphatase FliY [Spirochaetaceae bacterium]|jgi:flagellar motor switch protein FliN/FliY|nr:flagellar motor switch phosphatase FliY [Spirochaetaceae bacterium]